MKRRFASIAALFFCGSLWALQAAGPAASRKGKLFADSLRPASGSLRISALHFDLRMRVPALLFPTSKKV